MKRVKTYLFIISLFILSSASNMFAMQANPNYLHILQQARATGDITFEDHEITGMAGAFQAALTTGALDLSNFNIEDQNLIPNDPAGIIGELILLIDLIIEGGLHLIRLNNNQLTQIPQDIMILEETCTIDLTGNEIQDDDMYTDDEDDDEDGDGMPRAA